MPDEFNSVSEISTTSSFAVNHGFSIKKDIAMFMKRHFHVLSKLTIQIFVEQSPVFLSHEYYGIALCRSSNQTHLNFQNYHMNGY